MAQIHKAFGPLAAALGFGALGVAIPLQATAQSSEVLVAGATTKGGLQEGAQVIHVTTLADSGPGSLREAIETKGPRVIVFDVGGAIELASELKIHAPFVTIAGQTAPSPGVSLWGNSVRIRTHDVVIQHIAVRAGPGETAKINDNRDAISIDGSPTSPIDMQSFQVRLENVSASWSVDETVSLYYASTRQVTVRHSFVTEALDNAGHPKGPHSMALLIGNDVQQTDVTGNLLASSMFRNPVVGKGASAYVANNYIVNPGQNAIHFYDTGSEATTSATVVNNFIQAGPDTKKTLKAIAIPMGADGAPAPDVIFVDGNLTELNPAATTLSAGEDLTLAKTPPVESANWTLLPAEAVKEDVLRYAGTRPADRDPVDRRLLAEIAAGTEHLVDAPPEKSDVVSPTERVAAVPADALTGDAAGVERLGRWLCDQHFAVGGAPSADCPAN